MLIVSMCIYVSMYIYVHGQAHTQVSLHVQFIVCTKLKYFHILT